MPSVSTRWSFTQITPTFSLVPSGIIDTMARIAYLLFSLMDLSFSAAQIYTSLENMPAWSTLPPAASNAAARANGLYYAGCPAFVPEISTAACYATLPAMSSSLLSNIVSANSWNPSVPTQFQASATSVAKEWYGQPAVKAAVGKAQLSIVLTPLTGNQALTLLHRPPQAPRPRPTYQRPLQRDFRGSVLRLRSSQF